MSFNDAALKTPEPMDAYDRKQERERQKLDAKLVSGDLYYIKQVRGMYCGYDDDICANHIPTAALAGTFVSNNRRMSSYQSINGIGTLNALNEVFKHHKNGLKLVKTTKATPSLVKSVESKVVDAVVAHCKKLGVKVSEATATTITGTYKGKYVEITASSMWSWHHASIDVGGVLFCDPDHHMSFEDVKLLDVGPTLVRKPKFESSLLKLAGFDPVQYRNYILTAKTPTRYHDAKIIEGAIQVLRIHYRGG